MAIPQVSGRQYPLIAKIPFTYEDLVAGSAVRALGLPGNATVIGGEVVIETAWDTAGGTTPADSFDIGDADDSDRYAAGVDARTVGRTALTLTGFKTTAPSAINVTWTQNGDKTTDPTQGAAYLLVEYVLEDRAHEAQPEPI